VVAVVVLGQDDPQRTKRGPKPIGGAPAQVGRVSPPDVQLAKQEPGDRSRPRKLPERGGDQEVRDCPQEAVE